MVLAPPSRYHSAWGAGGWWPGVVGGRVAFRKYDNDSHARRRGTYELTNARRLWVRCTMIAITTENSALHRAVEASLPCARSRVSRHLFAPTPRQALVTGAGSPALVVPSDIYNSYN